jgi:tRNA modification GTPase
MSFGTVSDAQGAIDSVLLLSFIAPHSFTGQDVVEIQCHGSTAVVGRLERLFVEQGFRPAERGEFTYRAYQLGKLSTQGVESLGDVFLAKDASDLDRIYRRKDAAVEAEIGRAREDLVRLQAILDTAVDFSDEYSHVVESARAPLAAALERCDTLAGRYEALRSGARVPRLVLAGRPNAGKSSLFNALLCRYRAIVHEAAGTTRDAIEEDIELAGRRWKLVDTAGVRDSAATDAEREGIELGSDFLESAQFWILVVDGTVGISEPERALLERFGDKPHSVVWNKKDLPGFRHPEPLGSESPLAVSARTGDSVRELAAALKTRVAPVGDLGPLPSSVQARRLREAAAELEALRSDLDAGVPPEVLGERNRGVLRKLESVVGDVGVEDVLDRVFSEFCIGK